MNSCYKHHISFNGLKLALELSGMHFGKVSAGWSFPVQKHRLIEINTVIEGEQLLAYDGREYVMKQGDFALIRPGANHAFGTGNCESLTYFCVHVHLNDTMLRKALLISSMPVFYASSPQFTSVSDSLRGLAQYIAAEQPNFINSVKVYVHLLSFFDQYLDALSYHSSNFSNNCIQVPSLASEISIRIEQLASHDCTDDIPGNDGAAIASIAQAIGFSMSHCNRIFRQSYGMSPREYLSMMKLEQAKLLLLSKELTIVEIAARLGYSNASHFSRQFNRWTGLSPTVFRDQMK